MIYGVTHQADGRARQKLATAYKVSIGIPADGNNNYPKKSDRFHIRVKNGLGEWIDDNNFAESLRHKYMMEIDVNGKKERLPLREFEILFLHDSDGRDAEGNWQVPESVFRTELAWWATSEKKCSGNGQVAQRSVTALPLEEQRKHGKDMRYIPWQPCGDACPDLEGGRCKPSGNLYFIFKDRPIVGSVAAYTTTSYETIIRIQSSLIQIMQITGGRLRGIPLKIVMRPGKTTYVDKDGKRKSGHAFFVNIEFRQEDYAALIPKLIEHSAEYAHQISAGRRALPEHTDEEPFVDEAEIIERPEGDVAQEMTAEFYPDNRSPVPPGTPLAVDEQAINRICAAYNITAAQRELLYRNLHGDIAVIEKWLRDFDKGCTEANIANDEMRSILTRAITTPEKLNEIIATAAQKAPEKAPEPPPPKAPLTRSRRATTQQQHPPASEQKTEVATTVQIKTQQVPDGWQKPEETKPPTQQSGAPDPPAPSADMGVFKF